jgi:ubiquitin-protein ligase/stress response protein SCP2
MKDLEELRRHPIPGVVAEPLESNILEWHANLIGHADSPTYDGVILHLIIRFQPTYPSSPPVVEVRPVSHTYDACASLRADGLVAVPCQLSTDFPHPNVVSAQGSLRVCLEMLELPRADSLIYHHWSSAFSVSSVLLQLRSFLLQEGQTLLTNYRVTLHEAIQTARAFTCPACNHTHDHPVPAPAQEEPEAVPKRLVTTDLLKLLQSRRRPTPARPKLAPAPVIQAGLAPKLSWASAAAVPAPAPLGVGEGGAPGNAEAVLAEQKPAAKELSKPKDDDSGWITVPVKPKAQPQPQPQLQFLEKGKKLSTYGSGPAQGLGKSKGSKGAAKSIAAPQSMGGGKSHWASKLDGFKSAPKYVPAIQPSLLETVAKVNAALEGKGKPKADLAAKVPVPPSKPKEAQEKLSSSNMWTALADDEEVKGKKAYECKRCSVIKPASAFSESQLKKTGRKVCMVCKSQSKPGGEDKPVAHAADDLTPTPTPLEPEVAADPEPEPPKAWKEGWSEDQAALNAGLLGTLEQDALLRVLDFLDPVDVARVGMTCRFASTVADDGIIWKELFSRQYPRSQLTARNLKDWKYLFGLEVNQCAEELCCFYTKATPDEDVLGIAIDFTRCGIRCLLREGARVGRSLTCMPMDVSRRHPKTNLVDYVYSSMDILSLTAFRDIGVRRNVWNEKFNAWLPLYLNDEHFERALPYIKALCVQLSPQGGPGKLFFPSMVLDVLPKLLCTFVVLISDRGLAASERALEGYCQLHRLFLALMDRYPSLTTLVEERLKSFIESEGARHKDQCKSLGELIPLLSVSRRYTWRDLVLPYLQENFARNFLWAANAFPELARTNLPAAERLAKTFEGSTISRRLTLFNAYFASYVAHPRGMSLEDVKDRLDMYHGRPPLHVKRDMQRAVVRIMAVKSWGEFFTLAGVTVPTEPKLVAILEGSLRTSLRLGYHNSTTPFGRMRHNVSRVLLRGGEKYNVSSDLSKVVMRDEWRYDGGETRYLDASCLVYSFQGEFMTVLDYRNTMGFRGALQHTGDVIDYNHRHGRHEITINLAALPRKVQSLFFTLSAWHTRLDSILHPSVTLQDPEARAELCKYELEDKEKGDFTSVLMCQLYRERPQAPWQVRAIGRLGYGCADAYDPIKAACAEFVAAQEQPPQQEGAGGAPPPGEPN